jgi:hypothetical protein
LHVSSVVKYAFASHVSGCRPIITEGVLYSAFSPVKGAFRLGRAGRFVRTNTTRPSTAGYSARTVPPFASDPLGRDVAEWFFGFVIPWDVDAKRLYQ